MSASTGTAIAAAIGAGGFLAATGVLQQRAASRRPREESLSFRLLWALAHDRTWIAGIATGFVSYGFQALALAFGPLSLVQPIFLSELLFAVPISVGLNRMRMRHRDWVGLFAVAGGLACGIVSAWPRKGNPLPDLNSWAAAVGAVAFLAAGAVAVGRALSGPARSSSFAFGAAAVMALQSAFLDATVALVEKGPADLFTGWEAYALVPATAVGMLLVMSAYQAGPLAASMPVIDACEPAVAIVIGLAVFGEHVRTGAANLAGTGVGLGLFFLGIVLLDTSPIVHALQRKQDSLVEASGG